MEANTVMMKSSVKMCGDKGRGEVPGTVTAATGTACPCSGEWEIVGTVTTTAVFSKQDLMSEYHGRTVLWMLIRAG